MKNYRRVFLKWIYLLAASQAPQAEQDITRGGMEEANLIE